MPHRRLTTITAPISPTHSGTWRMATSQIGQVSVSVPRVAGGGQEDDRAEVGEQEGGEPGPQGDPGREAGLVGRRTAGRTLRRAY